MRSAVMVMLMLIMTLETSCEREVNRPPEQSGQTEKAKPAEKVVLTDEEKLRSLGPEAADSKVASLCLRLRAVYASGSLPSDLRQRCTRSMLTLAENSESTSKSADDWLSLAAEFGAGSVAIAKAKRSVAASRAKNSETESVSFGTKIENESYANQEDTKQAKQFLASLPDACSGSRATVARNGTVTIRLSCEGNNNSMRGSIKIRNGIVTKVQ